MAGLGIILGTTALSTSVALADEGEAVDESSSSVATTPESEGPRPVSGSGGLLEELRFTSEEELLAPSFVSLSSRRTSDDRTSEAFESAEEGEEGVWNGQRRRLSRKTSNLPTIHDTSPNQDQTEEFEGDSVELPDQPITVSFGYALDGSSKQSSSGGDTLEDDDGPVPPTSVKQLVRESWRLSKMSDRDFTALDDKRLSVRATERNDDGLGLSLEMFDDASVANGAHSSYTPSARPPISRNPTSADTIQVKSSAAASEFPFPSSPSGPTALNTTLEVISPVIGPVSPPLPESPAVLRVKTSFSDFRKPRSRKATPDSPTRLQLTSPALEAHTARTSAASSVKSPTFAEPASPSGMTRSPSGMTRSPSGSIRRKLSLREPRSRESSTSDSAPVSAAVKGVKRLSSLFSIGKSSSKDDIALLANGKPGESEPKPRRRAATEMISRVHPATVPSTPARPPPQSRSSKASPTAQLQSSPFDSIPESTKPSESLSPPASSPSQPPSRVSSRPSSLIGSGASSRRSSTASSRASLDLLIPVRAGSMLPPSGPTIPPRRGHDEEQEVLLELPLSAKSGPPLVASPFMARTWRSTLNPIDYDALKIEHGPLEMRRQEVIWELCETERSFVTGLRGVIRVFTLPLRTPNGAWIKGVPVPVSRLLDWLDDIVYLHSQISQALEQVREDAPRGLVQRIATAFLPFVAKLEVHQPYLVRFDSVTKSIDEMTADPDSDFGEFVRMQSALPECASLSLSSFLLKPVQRLMKYPLFFRQLGELTPATHPDHLAILSLLHSTDSVIRVMQEVKTREDEYEQAKILQSRLKNLPQGFQLAVRDRRLVAHGQLKRVHIGDRDRAALEMDALARSSQATIATSRKSKSDKNGRPVSAGGVRPSMEKKHSFTDAFRDEAGSPRFSPQFSSPNLSAQLQLNSPAIGPVRRVVKTKAKESSVHVFVFSDLVLLATKTSDGSSTPSLTPSLAAAARFGRPSASRTGSSSNTKRSSVPEIGPTYKVLEAFGVSRVLGVSDLSGKTEHDHLIQVDLLPLTAGAIESSLAGLSLAGGPSTSTQPTSIYLTLPERSPLTPGLSPRMESPLKERRRWIEAFERSYMFALRSLSFPSSALNSFTAPITQTEWLGAAVGTGARSKVFPRSPSEQRVLATTGASAGDSGASSAASSKVSLNDKKQGPDNGKEAKDGPRRPSMMGAAASVGELAQQEREERGWWSVRLRQVTRELEAQQASQLGWGKTPTQEDGRTHAPPRVKARPKTAAAAMEQPVEGLGIST